jgi:hypothetical protein
MNTLIIGSGFGLYGYLPAIAKFSKKIYLDNKYKKKINKRKTLKIHLKKIIWYLDIKTIINQIDYVIIAQKPKNQYSLVLKLLNLIKPKHLFLEKPISNNPTNSLKLIEILKNKKINFSVGYIFKYLDWFEFIYKNLTKKKKFKITWEVKLNNKNNFWKYKISEGGGLIRFYAIHLIRLIFDLNLTKINKKIVKRNHLYFNFSDKLKNNIYLNIKFSKYNRFILNYNDKDYYKGPNPFLRKIDVNIDPRVKIIDVYINKILKHYKTNYSYEKKFILFWKKLEN